MTPLPLTYLIASAVIALAITSSNVQAQVYKCVDKGGKTTYQQSACPSNAKAAAKLLDEHAEYAQAVKLGRSEAEQGNANAQYRLGINYATGGGVPEDKREAVKWWSIAAAQGHAGAQYSLGTAYLSGTGVPKDERESVKWWRLAAAQGHAGAQFSLGAAYDQGWGVAENEQEAVKWWGLAAAQGDEQAQHKLNTLSLYKKPKGASQVVASQPVPDPFAPPQTASHRATPLDRAVMGGISGAVLGVLAGLFILVRALIKKFKAPAAAGAMAIYRDRPQGVMVGVAMLLGCGALLAYLLFFRTNTVDDYLNDYPGRLEKLQECGRVPDMTKDRECMNAYTAQRMFMLR